jgi:hypothetical protein
MRAGARHKPPVTRRWLKADPFGAEEVSHWPGHLMQDHERLEAATIEMAYEVERRDVASAQGIVDEGEADDGPWRLSYGPRSAC